jgi:catechol 2,3-dioxygenase-like lactoylglutathione lyase family enzyme
MIKKLDHIGIVVDDLDAALAHFRRLFDFDDRDLIYHRDYDDVDKETGAVDKMHFCLFPVGEVYMELIEPASDGPMKAFLDRTGGGFHHLGITSGDIKAEWERHSAGSEDFGVVGSPRVDQFDVSYWFLHPKRNYKVLFEIDAAWAKTSASDMTPIEPTPDWSATSGG